MGKPTRVQKNLGSPNEKKPQWYRLFHNLQLLQKKLFYLILDKLFSDTVI